MKFKVGDIIQASEDCARSEPHRAGFIGTVVEIEGPYIRVKTIEGVQTEDSDRIGTGLWCSDTAWLVIRKEILVGVTENGDEYVYYGVKNEQ